MTTNIFSSSLPDDFLSLYAKATKLSFTLLPDDCLREEEKDLSFLMDKKVVALASDVAGGPIQEVIIHDPFY